MFDYYRIWLRVAAVVVAITGVLGLMYVGLSDKAELSELHTTTQTVTESNKISGAVLVSNAQEKAVAARSGASVALSVQSSIQKSPEWARQGVPQDVQEALNAPD